MPPAVAGGRAARDGRETGRVVSGFLRSRRRPSGGLGMDRLPWRLGIRAAERRCGRGGIPRARGLLAALRASPRRGEGAGRSLHRRRRRANEPADPRAQGLSLCLRHLSDAHPPLRHRAGDSRLARRSTNYVALALSARWTTLFLEIEEWPREGLLGARPARSRTSPLPRAAFIGRRLPTSTWPTSTSQQSARGWDSARRDSRIGSAFLSPRFATGSKASGGPGGAPWRCFT